MECNCFEMCYKQQPISITIRSEVDEENDTQLYFKQFR